MSAAPHLAVDGLTMRFGGLTALDGVSFDVEAGSIFSVIGPNGSGKSTLFNCISGVQPPTGGRVRVRGADVTGMTAHRVARLGVARTFQNLELLGVETTLENLMLARHRHMSCGLWRGMAMVRRSSRAAREEREHRARATHYLALLGLDDVRDRPVRTLPYGTQKRVELARALATEPELLMLDEPTAGMSEEERAGLAGLLRRVRDELGITVLLIEHHLSLAIGLADRVLALNFGRVIAEGAPEEVRADAEVVRAYLGGHGHE